MKCTATWWVQKLDSSKLRWELESDFLVPGLMSVWVQLTMVCKKSPESSVHRSQLSPHAFQVNDPSRCMRIGFLFSSFLCALLSHFPISLFLLLSSLCVCFWSSLLLFLIVHKQMTFEIFLLKTTKLHLSSAVGTNNPVLLFVCRLSACLAWCWLPHTAIPGSVILRKLTNSIYFWRICPNGDGTLIKRHYKLTDVVCCMCCCTAPIRVFITRTPTVWPAHQTPSSQPAAGSRRMPSAGRCHTPQQWAPGPVQLSSQRKKKRHHQQTAGMQERAAWPHSSATTVPFLPPTSAMCQLFCHFDVFYWRAPPSKSKPTQPQSCSEADVGRMFHVCARSCGALCLHVFNLVTQSQMKSLVILIRLEKAWVQPYCAEIHKLDLEQSTFQVGQMVTSVCTKHVCLSAVPLHWFLFQAYFTIARRKAGKIQR